MRENKDLQIKFRLTASQKKAIEQYCAANDLTISEFLRQVINEYLNGGNKNG